MKKRTTLIFLCAIIIIVIVAVAYSENSKTLKIGVIDVLSGPNATLGENFQKGIDLALSVYQAAHSNQKVQLFIEDDGDNSTTTLAAYHTLIDSDHVDALVVATTQSINTIYPYVSKLAIPVISYGSENTPEVKDNVFHIFPSPIPTDFALGFFLHAMSPQNAASSTIGIYTDDSTLTQFYSAFKDGYGVNISEFNLDPSMTDKNMHDVAAQVLKDNPKFIFMTNYISLGIQFIQALKDLSGGKIKQTFAFDLTLNHVLDQYQKSLGDLSFLDGSYVVSLKLADPTTFTAQYKQKYGSDPVPLSDYAYDAMNALFASYNSNSSTWTSNLQNLKVTGATGDISFDPVGRRIPAFTITTLQDGKIPDDK